MPTLYVVIGVESSGKTTWIKKKVPDLPLVSVEEWPKFKGDGVAADGKGMHYWIDDDGRKHRCIEYSERTPAILAEAWAWVWRRVGELLQSGQDFVFEGTFPTRMSRIPVINIARSFGYTIFGIWIDTDLKTCIEQNKRYPVDVLARTFADMEPIDWDEGWNGGDRISTGIVYGGGDGPEQHYSHPIGEGLAHLPR